MSWMMRAISALCRIASRRLRSEGRRRISSRSRDFSRNRASRRMRHNLTRESSLRGRASRPERPPGFANRQDRQGNRFPDRVLRPDRPSPSGMKVIGTTGTAAMVVRGISARTAIPPGDERRRRRRRGVARPSALHHCEPKTHQRGYDHRSALARRSSFLRAYRDARGKPRCFRVAARRKRLSSPRPAQAATIAIWI